MSKVLAPVSIHNLNVVPRKVGALGARKLCRPILEITLVQSLALTAIIAIRILYKGNQSRTILFINIVFQRLIIKKTTAKVRVFFPSPGQSDFEPG